MLWKIKTFKNKEMQMRNIYLKKKNPFIDLTLACECGCVTSEVETSKTATFC